MRESGNEAANGRDVPGGKSTTVRGQALGRVRKALPSFESTLVEWR
jgi:hypothetical protein